MNKTALKIFGCFTVLSAFIATILLIINFFGFAAIGSDTHAHIHGVSPKDLLSQLSEAIKQTDTGFVLTQDDILPLDFWCILIDEKGSVVWSQNMPEDIPRQYSINDIARMTRWFLNDYPVYVRTEDYGLFVLGMPKNTVGKYDIVYSMKWFDTLPQRLTGIIILNLFLAAGLAFMMGLFLYKRICVLSNGINDLRRERCVRLKEKGIFKELAKGINDTSKAIERKNAALAVRDHARLNWISCISHDIRTPLALVLGNSEALEKDKALTERNRQKAKTITAQSIRIKKLIEDLNLISSLEYDMQPTRRKPVRLCPLIREMVSAVINSGLGKNCEIELDLQDEKASACADASLLERAIFNVISNSITHNTDGCTIKIKLYTTGKTAHITISDDGKGVPASVIEKISEIPKSAHGLGLPMAYKIVSVHNGRMTVRNDNGFVVEIQLPM